MGSRKSSRKAAPAVQRPAKAEAAAHAAGLSPDQPGLSPAQKLGAFAAAWLPFSVYVYFLCPTIAAGDSAELVTSARILGISHPPGYPLFTVIGHLFSLLPLQAVAWRVNLASAFFCALTCLFVYLTLLRVTRRPWAALIGAWALAFSRYFWHYAEVAEVFPLNDLFAAVLTHILISIHQHTGDGRDPVPAQVIRRFWLLGFVYGLAFTNHHTIILLAPAVLLVLWFGARPLFRYGKIWLVAALFFMAGFTFYVYCPIAALANPAINWDDPVSIAGFVRLLTRADYGTFSLMASEVTGNMSTSRFSQLLSFVVSLNLQFTALGIGLALLGILNFRRHRMFQGYLALAFLLSGIFFVLYAKVPTNNPLLLGVFHRFFILPALFFAFWIGLGMDHVLGLLEQRKPPRALLTIPPILLVVGLTSWLLLANVDEADFRDNYMAEDFAHNILAGLPENSLFLVRGDVASMGIDYLQMVLGRRPDVACLDQAKLTYDWYYRQAKQRFPKVALPGERYDGRQVVNRDLIAANLNRFPISFMSFKEESYQRAYRAVPVGLAYRMLSRSQAFSLEELEKRNEELHAQFVKRGWGRKYAATSFENELMQIYAEPFFRLGFEFEQGGRFDKADGYYNKTLQMNPLNYKVLKNLAVLYFYRMNRQQDGIEHFRRYLELNPGDVEAGKIRELVDGWGVPR